jgi:hypothetical protein
MHFAKTISSAVRCAPTNLVSDGNLCYGTEVKSDSLVSFYTNAPGELTFIGPTGSSTIWASDFLYGDFTRLLALNNSNVFMAINTSNSHITVISTAVPAEDQEWTGLAGDPTDNTLYAASSDLQSSYLYIIEPADGVVTPVGMVSNATGLIAIAINAQGELYGLDIIDDVLLRINKKTADADVIGPIGFDANYGQGMDFDEVADILYLAAFNADTFKPEFRVADTATGTATLAGVLGDGNGQLGSLAVATGGHAIPAWVTAVPESGTIPGHASLNVSVIFSAVTVTDDGYYSAACFFSGTFVNEPDPLPVSMYVPEPAAWMLLLLTLVSVRKKYRIAN